MLKYHIQTIDLSSTQSTISFNNIPQNFTDIYFLISGRINQSGAFYTDVEVRLNNVPVSGRSLLSFANNVASNTSPTIRVNSAASTTNIFGNTIMYISNYTGNGNKAVSFDYTQETNGVDGHMGITAASASVSSAINTVDFVVGGGFGFVAGSSISLYGIRRGVDGRTEAASGGTITTSGGYTIHTFNTSGTFVANRDLNVEYLVIGGGGGGGFAAYSGAVNRGGSGGAGGYRCSVPGESSGGGSSAEPTMFIAASASYPVIVGAGAPGGNGLGPAANGANSVFGNITANGGAGAFGVNAPNAQSGGSGSGGAALYNSGTSAGGSGISGQGFAGGTGNAVTLDYGSAGGGGGAGGPGQNAGAQSGGNGGIGVTSSITGTAVARAGGAGGSGRSSGGTGVAGGASGRTSIGAGNSGTANTGGGGSGAVGTEAVQNGGNGGSGVVIIRYLTP